MLEPVSIGVFKEKKLNLELQDVTAKIIYHRYDRVLLNSILVSFIDKRHVLSTEDGIKDVRNVANVYIQTFFPQEL
jgi:hypothetical protein